VEKMANQDQKQQRDFTLSVRLRPDTREKLGLVADAFGVSPATVASMAIGQYVATQHASLCASSKAMETMIGSIAPGVLEAIKTMSESETPCFSLSEPLELPQPSAVALAKKPAKSFPPAQSFKSKRSTTGGSSK